MSAENTQMTAVRLEGQPSSMGFQMVDQLVGVLSKDGPLADMDQYEREAFYAGMLSGILACAVQDVGSRNASNMLGKVGTIFATTISPGGSLQ